MRRARALVLIAGAILAHPLAAQTPEGPEIRVSSQPGGFNVNAAVATAANGDFVVVWQGRSGTVNDRVWIRRFSASGKPRGHEFLADPATPKNQEVPVVAMAPGGGFLVAWNTVDQLLNTQGFVRCFSAGGRALGPALRINSSGSAAAAAAPDGSFLVLWSSADGVLARRFAADGRPIGSTFKPLPEEAAFRASLSVSADGNGGFLVGWRSSTGFAPGTPSTLRAQRLDAEGQPLGEPFSAPSTPYTPNYYPGTVMAVTDAGESLFVWAGAEPGVPPDSHGFPRLGILGQRLSADGMPLGKILLIHDGIPLAYENPSVAALPGGGYFVVWTTNEYASVILGRSVASDGSLGDEVQISGSHRGLGPAVAFFRNGRGVVVWSTALSHTIPLVLRRLSPP